MGEIDWWLLVLAVLVHPSIRDEVWNALGDNGEPVLSDQIKFWLTVHALENDGQAIELVRLVVKHVVAQRYVEEEV